MTRLSERMRYAASVLDNDLQRDAHQTLSSAVGTLSALRTQIRDWATELDGLPQTAAGSPASDLEQVAFDTESNLLVYRMRVPGGWLYVSRCFGSTHASTTFVPSTPDSRG